MEAKMGPTDHTEVIQSVHTECQRTLIKMHSSCLLHFKVSTKTDLILSRVRHKEGCGLWSPQLHSQYIVAQLLLREKGFLQYLKIIMSSLPSLSYVEGNTLKSVSGKSPHTKKVQSHFVNRKCYVLLNSVRSGSQKLFFQISVFQWLECKLNLYSQKDYLVFQEIIPRSLREDQNKSYSGVCSQLMSTLVLRLQCKYEMHIMFWRKLLMPNYPKGTIHQ